MDKDKVLKGFGAIVGLLTASTLLYNYPYQTLGGLGLMGLGAYIHSKLKK